MKKSELIEYIQNFDKDNLQLQINELQQENQILKSKVHIYINDKEEIKETLKLKEEQLEKIQNLAWDLANMTTTQR